MKEEVITMEKLTADDLKSVVGGQSVATGWEARATDTNG
jgi:hypothetical protein